MKFFQWIWRKLFGPKDDGAWVIVEFDGATVRLYNQETIDWFFGSDILDGRIVDRLTIIKGSVDFSTRKNVNTFTMMAV